MTKLNALKQQLIIWGGWTRYRESNISKVKSPQEIIEEIGRVGIYSHGTGYMDQRADNIPMVDWVAAIDRDITALPDKSHIVIIRAEFVEIVKGKMKETDRQFIKARKLRMSFEDYKSGLSSALIALLSMQPDPE